MIADEVSGRVIERYEGVILTLNCIPSRFGDEATWAFFAGVGVVAAVLGGLALVGLDRRAQGGRSAVLEV